MVGRITPDRAEVGLTQLKGSTRDHNPLLYLELLYQKMVPMDVGRKNIKLINWRSHESSTRRQLQSHNLKNLSKG